VLAALSLATAITLASPNSAFAGYSHSVVSFGSDSLETVQIFPGSHLNSPLVVMVHGGGFRSSPVMAKGLTVNAIQLNSAGAAVFIVNYRSSSAGFHIDDQVADVVAGTQWAIAHAATYNANPANVIIVGGSSGGLLAADAALALNTVPGTVRGLVTLSGPMDLTSSLDYWLSTPGHVSKIHQRNISSAVGCSLPVACPASATGPPSPINQVSASNCPGISLVVNGSTEVEPVSQADEMAAALQSHGCSTTERILATSLHAFDYWRQIEPDIEALWP
jgi:acetyl esterase/lipase